MLHAEDFMLLILHTHTVAAAKALLKDNPTTTVQELARLVLCKTSQILWQTKGDDPDPTQLKQSNLSHIALNLIALMVTLAMNAGGDPKTSKTDA